MQPTTEGPWTLGPASSTVAHPLLSTLQPRLGTPRSGPSNTHRPASSLTVLPASRTIPNLPPAPDPTQKSWLPRHFHLEVPHHFMVNRFKTESIKKRNNKNENPASTARLLPLPFVHPHIQKPQSHPDVLLSFVPHSFLPSPPFPARRSCSPASTPPTQLLQQPSRGSLLCGFYGTVHTLPYTESLGGSHSQLD